MVAFSKPTRIPPPLDITRSGARVRLLDGNSRHSMKRFTTPHIQTRLRIVLAAADLFHEKGVRATSIGEIIKAARVTRQELSQHFRTKGDIAVEVVRAYLTEIKTHTSQLHCKLDTWKGLERTLAAHIALLRQFHMRRGCPLGIIGNELTEKDEPIREELKLVFEVLKDRIATFLEKEKSEGRLLPKTDEGQVAEFCVAAMQGAMLMGKVRRNSETVATIFEDLMLRLKRYRIE